MDASDSSLLKTCRGDREKIASIYAYSSVHVEHTHIMVIHQRGIFSVGYHMLGKRCLCIFSVLYNDCQCSISKKIKATAREFGNHCHSLFIEVRIRKGGT